MIMTMRPTSVTVAAGTATWASTLAIGHRRARHQARPAGRLRREAASPRADGPNVPGHLRLDDGGEPRVKGAEVTLRRKSFPFRPERFVAGGTRVARLHTRQLPDHPIRRFDQPICRGVDLGGLVQNLQRFGEEPLRRDLSAVAIEPGLPHLPGHSVDLVRLRLGGVVFPEFHPGVRLAAPRRQHAQGRSVRPNREHRAGGEIDPHTDDVLGGHPGVLEHPRDCDLQRAEVILRVLQGPVRRERDARPRQPLVDDPMGVGVHRRRRFVPRADFDQDGSAGLRPEVHTDGSTSSAGSAAAGSGGRRRATGHFRFLRDGRDPSPCICQGLPAGSRRSVTD